MTVREALFTRHSFSGVVLTAAENRVIVLSYFL
jgi:hypothetical protein